MKEYELYLPGSRRDGRPVDAGALEKIKASLAKAFGGYTHLRHRNEGAWSVGGVTFHDEITIIRVLDDGTAKFDMRTFKKALEQTLDQETILIVERHVGVVS
jgi:hypothetical protein